jgi:hypothetical protein
MVGEAVNLDLVLVNADYAFDHSDWDAGLIESATLLDVQLQITMNEPGAIRASARFIGSPPILRK